MSTTTTRRINRRGLLYLALLAVAIVALALAGCSQSPAAATDSPKDQVSPTLTRQPAVAESPTVGAAATPTLPPDAAQGVACAAGVVNDPYPGHCKRYVDANNNGLCDLSELGSGNVEPRVRIQ